MGLLAFATAYVAVIGIVVLELWAVSGQRFGLFCVLLVLVGQTVFVGALALGDLRIAALVGRRVSGFLFALTFPATIVLAAIACVVLFYQLVSLAPTAPCGEVCMP